MCSSLTSHGFVSHGLMVGFAFIVEGMSVTRRPVLWSGINLEVEGSSWSWAMCHSIIRLSLLSLQAMRYREDNLVPHVVSFLQAHPDITLQHDNATSRTGRSVQDFLQDRNVHCTSQVTQWLRALYCSASSATRDSGFVPRLCRNRLRPGGPCGDAQLA
jgi:hypothetical protein